MVTTQYQFITQKQGVRGGRPYIKDVGVSVSMIIAMLKEGDALEKIVAAYHGLKPEHVTEANAYYAEHVGEIDTEIALSLASPAGYEVGLRGILKKK